MSNNLDLITLDQEIVEGYIQEMDKVPLEDKLIAMMEEKQEALAPWEISAIVDTAMNKLEANDCLQGGEEDYVYDVIFEAVEEAAHRR